MIRGHLIIANVFVVYLLIYYVHITLKLDALFIHIMLNLVKFTFVLGKKGPLLQKCVIEGLYA
jgi:hypothetical protein